MPRNSWLPAAETVVVQRGAAYDSNPRRDGASENAVRGCAGKGGAGALITNLAAIAHSN
jgi:hypothetical protein